MTAIPMLAPRINAYTSLGSLVCRDHHRVPHGQTPTEHGFWRCDKPGRFHRRECGLWVYIVIVRDGGAFVTDVSAEEAAALNDPRLPPDQILRELRKRRNAA